MQQIGKLSSHDGGCLGPIPLFGGELRRQRGSRLSVSSLNHVEQKLFLNSERASSSLLRRYIEVSKYKTVSKIVLVFTIWSTPIGCSRGDVVSFSCQVAPTSGDTGFLNSFFPDWFSWPAEQRLPFRYNALRTMYWWLAQTLAIFASRGALSVNATSSLCRLQAFMCIDAEIAR